MTEAQIARSEGFWWGAFGFIVAAVILGGLYAMLHLAYVDGYYDAERCIKYNITTLCR